ncbi:hypothetical protein D9758_007861 [Tetrapyrgos nigripes]|uniref:Major facilitator superfamily (MFS) profile domain-containing protein n=1 Tax=Tetrapyrgos nigripes TaxID=182062 RepID=A0A8H5CY72_9AGAR|nr:hypothetical protein D9758_007861 [Tetrapyrgos nigripes]
MPPQATGGGINVDTKNKIAGILMTSFAATAGILYGYDTGVISGLKEMPDWLRTFGHATGDPTAPYAISSSTESLVVSILSAGTFFGALAGAPIGDWIGRRYGIIIGCCVFNIGVAMQTASTAVPLFSAGRVFAGLGVGIVSCLVPMYQSECAPKWIRGAIVACYQWAITIGLLVAAIVNNATKDMDSHAAYRIPIGIQFVFAFVLSVGMLLLPESPRWLIKTDKFDDAAQSLSRLTGLSADDSVLQGEIAEIRANLEAELALGETSYLDCFRPTQNKILLRTLTGIFIQAWQQLTGINFIFYYGTTFFKQAGITNPFIITIATNVVNVGMTVPGIYGVERFGRRVLLLWGAVGMTVCEFIVAIVGATVSDDNMAGQRVLIAFVCIYIGFFASTWGPGAWIVCGEIFPLAIRAKAMSMATASNWLWNFGIGYATPYLVNDEPGSAGLGSNVFFIWGSTCLCCIIFTLFCTKGLSLEEIDLMYQHTWPMQSLKYRKQLEEADTVVAKQYGSDKDGQDTPTDLKEFA